MKKGEVTTDATETPRLVRDIYKQLHANKMNNLEEMDNYLERYNLPRLNQKEIDNMNRQITSNEIETVIQNLPTNKSPGPNDFTGKFYQTFKEELLLLLSCFSRVRLCATPEMAAHQAPPSLGFSRQEHWSGWPFPSPMHESKK